MADLTARTQIVRTVIDDGLPIDPIKAKDNPELTRFSQKVADLLNSKFGKSGPVS